MIACPGNSVSTSHVFSTVSNELCSNSPGGCWEFGTSEPFQEPQQCLRDLEVWNRGPRQIEIWNLASSLGVLNAFLIFENLYFKGNVVNSSSAFVTCDLHVLREQGVRPGEKIHRERNDLLTTGSLLALICKPSSMFALGIKACLCSACNASSFYRLCVWPSNLQSHVLYNLPNLTF